MKRALALLMVLALVIGQAGCANIQNDGTRTRTEGALVGGAGGAALGAGIGALADGGRGALIGAGIGLLAGLIGGYAVGDHIAKQKAKYAREEDWLEACITDLQAKNGEAEAYNAKLVKEIAMIDKDTARIAAQYKKNKATKSVVDDKAAQVSRKQQEVARNIQVLENEVTNYGSAVVDARKNNKLQEAERLDREIARTKKQIASLKKGEKRLASMSARVAS